MTRAPRQQLYKRQYKKGSIFQYDTSKKMEILQNNRGDITTYKTVNSSEKRALSSGQTWVLHTMDVDRTLCQHKWASHLFIKGLYIWVLVKIKFCLNLNCDSWPELTGKTPQSCPVTPFNLLLGKMLCAVNYIFGQLGSTGPAAFLPSFLPTSSPVFGSRVRPQPCAGTVQK